jgi:hypothetical protein
LQTCEQNQLTNVIKTYSLFVNSRLRSVDAHSLFGVISTIDLVKQTSFNIRPLRHSCPASKTLPTSHQLPSWNTRSLIQHLLLRQVVQLTPCLAFPRSSDLKIHELTSRIPTTTLSSNAPRSDGSTLLESYVAFNFSFAESESYTSTLYVSAALALIAVSPVWAMENRNGSNHQYHLSQGRSTQISAHYNSTASTPSAGQFKTPHLPQHNTSKPRAKPLAHPSYLGDEQLLTSPLYEEYQYGGVTPPSYQNNYVTHQQSSSSCLGSPDFTYGYQQIPWTQSSHHYTTYNMPSMSFPSSYGTPHTTQTYPSSTASYHDLSSQTAGPGVYEPISLDYQAFQTSGFTASDVKESYISHDQPQQQITRREDGSDLQELFDQYQMQTKEIFTLVKDRQLKPTASLLLDISRFLIGNVRALGLDRDDKGQYQDRLKLWDTFNHCWLTVLHCQHTTTQIMTRTGQQLPLEQSILDSDDLEMLGQEIVKLCDSIDKTGLIDYQMGVAEERIIDSKSLRPVALPTHLANRSTALLKCLDVMNPQSPNSSRSSGPSLSASVVRR